MKAAILALVAIATTTQAVQLASRGIPYPALMQEQPSHWRKVWPEGIDNSDGDADVMNAYSLPLKPDPKANARETYPWEYDHDIINTGKSIKNAEANTGNKMTYASVALKRGRDMVFENNKINTEAAGDDDRLKEAPKKNPNYTL